MQTDSLYMRRALQLAANGYGFTFTNPMVGAVITAPGGRIIGEGWHRRFGGPHAEVNAVRSVAEADRHLLPEATVFVTLEPCSHYGKTPPCAKLLVETGIRRIVIGATDPFPEVAGRGIRMLREAGREVTTGVLADECRRLNLPFMRAHETGRPYVTLKWAQSADGFMAVPATDGPGFRPVTLSSPAGQVAVHRLRASCQGVMTGVDTVIADNPRLDCRRWPVVEQPRPVSFDSPRLPADAAIRSRHPILRSPGESLADFLRRLYTDFRFNHLLVEGGARTLAEFIGTGLFDALRVEISPVRLGDGLRAPAYDPAALTLISSERLGDNTILLYHHGSFI